MGAPFPSTYKQVVENMKRINEIVSNYVQHLVDTIFNPTAWSDGSTDVKFDPTDNKLKVIGTTIASDNPNVQSGPSEYFRNVTWETKLASAMGLSDMPHIGTYVTVMTVSVPNNATWQVAYSDMHMATYFRSANADMATWSDWEATGRKQVIESETQPNDVDQDIGDYWYQPVDVGTPDCRVTCVGACRDDCENSCDNTCAAVCSSDCSGRCTGCSGCGSGCADSCSGTCITACSVSNVG